jgi:threonine/homoserine/homoserine lactone efflux protein
MSAFINFLLSFIFSFTGSLAPGTVNLSSLQLGLDNKAYLAWRFALAAAIMEYIYAFLAVTFEKFITSSPVIVQNFHLIAAIVMLTLGILNIRSASKPTNLSVRLQNSGFRRGLVLGILNPLAMPYWIGMVAYLKSQHWIDLTTPLQLHSFLLGVSAGVFTLLVLVAYLASRVIRLLRENQLIRKIPGYLMLILGIYALIRYIVMLLFPAT